MDPVTTAAIVLENVLATRARLLAHASAVWLAAQALDHVIGSLPPATTASWRGPAARAEAARVHEVADALADARGRLAALSDRIAHDTMRVDLHVG